MKANSFFDAWNGFFFAEQSPTPLALFRIAYGMAVIATLFLLHADWIAWYGPNAWVRLSTIRTMEPGPRLNLFTIIPQSDSWVRILFWVFLISAVCLACGLFTRVNSIIVFACLASIQQRNLLILHGGDTFLRVTGFFLMFAPAGAALSVDRLIRIWRGEEGAEIQPRRPWAQRMIQFELALLYFAGFCSKIEGGSWVQGTALYYVYHLDELQRFPIPPWFFRPAILRLATWFALVFEFSMGVLIWIKELRYPLLALGVLFHLSLEYSLNIPMFQWDVLAAYILFVDPVDLTRFWNWIRTRANRHLGQRVNVIYDGASERRLRTANMLRAIDIFGQLSFADLRDSRAPFDATRQDAQDELLVATNSGLRRGREGLCAIAGVVPLLWPLAILLRIQQLWAPRIAASSKAG